MNSQLLLLLLLLLLLNFPGYVPVLYGALSVGRTLLYVTRSFVTVVGYGIAVSYGTPIGHGYVPLLYKPVLFLKD